MKKLSAIAALPLGWQGTSPALPTVALDQLHTGAPSKQAIMQHLFHYRGGSFDPTRLVSVKIDIYGEKGLAKATGLKLKPEDSGVNVVVHLLSDPNSRWSMIDPICILIPCKDESEANNLLLNIRLAHAAAVNAENKNAAPPPNSMDGNYSASR